MADQPISGDAFLRNVLDFGRELRREGLSADLAAVLDYTRHTLTLVNAGHPSPLLYHGKSGAVREATPNDICGLPLGVMDGYEYQAITLPFQPGDCVVLFSDGVSEDVIGGLARFRSLSVTSASSSFSFRDRSVDRREIGRRLGVTYLVEGSVRRAGERIRVTAQLVEAASGAHLWSEHYDRSLTDIFAVPDEVTRTIVSTSLRCEDSSGTGLACWNR